MSQTQNRDRNPAVVKAERMSRAQLVKEACKISEITVHGEQYRLHDAEHMRRITRFAKAKSTSIQTTSRKPLLSYSWQTWKKFPTSQATREAWCDLWLHSEQYIGYRTEQMFAAKKDGKVTPLAPAEPEAPPAKTEGKKAKAEKPEVMPKTTALAKFPAVGNLDRAATVIDAEYRHWRLAEDDANVCLLGVGILLEAVRSAMPHGDFLPWMESNCSVGKSHAYRFRGVARKFLAQQKLILPEAVEMSRADCDTEEAGSFQERARKWIGGRSQSELFDACRPPKELTGGDHGGGSLKKLRMEAERLQARDQWEAVVTELREFARRKREVHIPKRVLKSGQESIRESLRQIGGRA